MITGRRRGGAPFIMPLRFYVNAPGGKLTALLKRAKNVRVSPPLHRPR